MPNDLSVWSLGARCEPHRAGGGGAAADRLIGVLGRSSSSKSQVISRSRRQAEKFETAFWSGGDLATLYRSIETKGRAGTGLQSIFESGFGEFSRLRQQGTPADQLLDGRAARHAGRAAARARPPGAQSRDARRRSDRPALTWDCSARCGAS